MQSHTHCHRSGRNEKKHPGMHVGDCCDYIVCYPLLSDTVLAEKCSPKVLVHTALTALETATDAYVNETHP